MSERLLSSFVLILDDDADSRFAAEAIYRQWGCRVLAVESAERAREALTEHLRSPDLIVSDFQLGESWNGVQAVETLRSDAECLIPAIILTGDMTALQSIQLDFSFTVLQKPAGPARLKEASERLLNLAPSGALPEPIDSSRRSPAYSETKA